MDASVVHLSKRYRRHRAVDDVTFTARAGRVTALIGANGAGKTTTLRMLLGLTSPTSGTVTIAGRVPRAAGARPGAIGAVLDGRAGHPGHRVDGFLRDVARLCAQPPGEADDALGTVGLGAFGGRRIGTLSLGMRQRLGLAAALAGRPELLVLDEPFNGLDPAGVHWLRGLLRSLADSGVTVLLSSHLLAELSVIADDIVLIDRGRDVASGTRASFGDDLEATFLALTSREEPCAR